jgi:hypothetical protein
MKQIAADVTSMQALQRAETAQRAAEAEEV